MSAECMKLRNKVEVSRAKLRATNCALHDITNENHLLRKYEHSKAKANKLKHRNEQLETECAQLELDLLSDEVDSDSDTNSDTSFHSADEPGLQDIIGHSPEIRKLLLADQVLCQRLLISSKVF